MSSNTLATHVCPSREHAGQRYFDGEVEPCVNGRTMETGAYFGVDVAAIVERILGEREIEPPLGGAQMRHRCRSVRFFAGWARRHSVVAFGARILHGVAGTTSTVELTSGRLRQDSVPEILRRMVIERFNPQGLHRTAGYHHVTVVDTGRTAYLAGQCPVMTDGSVVAVAGDLPARFDAQVDQVAANALVALAAAGADPEDVVRSVMYVVSDHGPTLAAVWRRFHESPLAGAFTTASTLLGVAQLGYPGQLVELDLTAVLP